MKLIFQQGYQKTTMPQIAAEAELAAGTLYLYFPGKDALYAELLHEGYRLLREELSRSAPRPGTPRLAGAAMIDAFFAFAREHGPYFAIIFRLLRYGRADAREEVLLPKQIQQLHESEGSCKAVAADVLRHVEGVAPARRKELVEAVWSMLSGVVFHFGQTDEFDAVARQARGIPLPVKLFEELLALGQELGVTQPLAPIVA